MTFNRLLVQTVTIEHVTTGASDAYGDATETVTTSQTPGRVDQYATAEQIAAGDFTTTNYRLFIPAGTAISSRDRVEVDGVTYQVAGDPNDMLGARTVHHLEVPLKRIEG